MPPHPTRPYLDRQRAAQAEHKCEYVIFQYAKDPTSTTRPPPCIPASGAAKLLVKLSQHVFMQMSFSVLKDRLMSPQQAPSQRGTSPSSSAPPSSDPMQREKDVVGLFMFLCHYLSQHTVGLPYAERVSLPTKQHLRFQLLLEYGVDVKQLLDRIPHDPDALQQYWRDSLAPHAIGEDEFLAQLAKPSMMAQTCCCM